MSGLNGDWYEALKGEFSKPYYRKLFETVNEEYRTKLIFPPAQDIFNAFHLTPLKDVKVVILGQDPYHNNGQAHGLSFSVQKGVDIPKSWVSDKMGRAGCVNVEHCADSTSASGELSQRNRMGRIHRCSDSGTEQPGQTDCLYSVGSSCTEEEENAYESKASYSGSTASKPVGCLQRFLWKQAIQSDKCISGEEWD